MLKKAEFTIAAYATTVYGRAKRLGHIVQIGTLKVIEKSPPVRCVGL
jgi:hypothetical protein